MTEGNKEDWMARPQTQSGPPLKLFAEVEEAFSASGLRGLSLVWGALSGSRRSELIAGFLGMRMVYLESPRRRSFLDAPFRYAAHMVQTYRLLKRERPDVVFVQNPPVFAPLAVYLSRRYLRLGYVVDSHSGALIYPQWKWSLPLQRFLGRRALSTLVTNRRLAKTMTGWGPINILESPPPPIETKPARSGDRDGFHVVAVCRGDPDEPVETIIEAARELPEVSFSLTGNLRGRRRWQAALESRSPNVELTGFLAHGYFDLLAGADAILCLTDDDYTFQSGANEALWLGRPLITTDLPVLREYFPRGTVFVANEAGDLVRGVREVQRSPSELTLQMVEQQTMRAGLWRSRALELVADLANADRERAR